MRITILTYGTRGDVEPFIPLSQALQESGYRVRLAAPGPFKELANSAGVEFFALPGDPTELSRRLVHAGQNPVSIFLALRGYAMPLAHNLLADVRRACDGSDAIIHSFLLTLSGQEMARELRVPGISALLFPVFSTGFPFANPLFPNWPRSRRYYRLTHRLFTAFFWRGNQLAYRWLRRRHSELPPLAGWAFDRRSGPAVRAILYGFSPLVVPAPEHSEGSPPVHVTGYWQRESPDWSPPPDLAAFLERGPAPVFIGFGSAVSGQGERLARLALQGLAETGQRGVLYGGWEGLGQAEVSEEVFRLEEAPFDWLFPRMRAVVHHGGAGTTAAALRAGKPQQVIPFSSDQPFWGRRVQDLGVGPAPLSLRRLNVDLLAAAIRRLVSDPQMRARSRHLAARLAGDDGVGVAVAHVRHYLGK